MIAAISFVVQIVLISALFAVNLKIMRRTSTSLVPCLSILIISISLHILTFGTSWFSFYLKWHLATYYFCLVLCFLSAQVWVKKVNPKKKEDGFTITFYYWLSLIAGGVTLFLLVNRLRYGPS